MLNAKEDLDTFLVPIGWRRVAPLPAGHEREAWCVWGAGAGGHWVIDPGWLTSLEAPTAVQFALRTLMYPAKYDSRGRLSCAGVLSDLAERSGSRQLWVAPEANSISIWTDVAFQYSYSKLGLP
jgi:hypothetical protein